MECKSGIGRDSKGVGIQELIDTLWNVNAFTSPNSTSALRINRYIMECKLSRHLRCRKATWGINRYIMECKYTHNLYNNLHYLELIDTLWNVNQKHLESNREVLRELIDTLWNVNVKSL